MCKNIQVNNYRAIPNEKSIFHVCDRIHFLSCSLMQACSQGIISKHQFYHNCFKGNMCSIMPCFAAFSYFFEYLLELLQCFIRAPLIPLMHSPHEIISTMGKTGQDPWRKRKPCRESSISATNQHQTSPKMY